MWMDPLTPHACKYTNARTCTDVCMQTHNAQAKQHNALLPCFQVGDYPPVDDGLSDGDEI